LVRPISLTRSTYRQHSLNDFPSPFKYTFSLSDDDGVEGWAETPYSQYFIGMKFFEELPPINPLGMK
jgi:hypothetical protein